MSPLRTEFLAAGIVAALAIGVAPGRSQAQNCPGGRLLLLTNGRIHTMDSKRTVVSRVRMPRSTGRPAVTMIFAAPD